jgi:hypothetical protein
METVIDGLAADCFTGGGDGWLPLACAAAAGAAINASAADAVAAHASKRIPAKLRDILTSDFLPVGE